MDKDKKEKPAMLNFDGKEYEIDKMTDSQKELAATTIRYNDHVRDVQNKLQSNLFMREQLVECEKVFVDKHQKSYNELVAVKDELQGSLVGETKGE